VLFQGGVEPPHSKVLRTAIFMSATTGDTVIKDLGKSAGYARKNVETPGAGLRPGDTPETQIRELDPVEVGNRS
jgi:hypothetical protein